MSHLTGPQPDERERLEDARGEAIEAEARHLFECPGRPVKWDGAEVSEGIRQHYREQVVSMVTRVWDRALAVSREAVQRTVEPEREADDDRGFSLCGNCGNVSRDDEWKGLNRDEATDALVPAPAGEEPHFLRCPRCSFDHTDDDSDPGVWGGTALGMYQERTRLLRDDEAGEWGEGVEGQGEQREPRRCDASLGTRETCGLRRGHAGEHMTDGLLTDDEEDSPPVQPLHEGQEWTWVQTFTTKLGDAVEVVSKAEADARVAEAVAERDRSVAERHMERDVGEGDGE